MSPIIAYGSIKTGIPCQRLVAFALAAGEPLTGMELGWNLSEDTPPLPHSFSCGGEKKDGAV